MYDKNRATVTTAASTAPSLQERLRAAGIIASEVNLVGRFHCDCYSEVIEQIVDFCDSDPTLQFPYASKLVAPIHANGEGSITEGKLHQFALRSILVDQSQWYTAFSTVHGSQLGDKEATVVGFGHERCVPPSILRSVNDQVVYMSNLEEAKARLLQGRSKPHFPPQYPQGHSDNDIAVVGYALKVAGADDSEEFWQLLCKGKSQHVEISPDKISFETHWRKVDPKRKWFGNFIRDPEAFDHKFFKRSPREVASQDPRQRLMMQVAYQAVEQSAYFHSPEPQVGCFQGVCATDYENNIACHDLTGKSAGIKLIFGTEEGRELVFGLYGDSMLNKLSYKMMEDFLRGLIAKLPMHEGPLKILEMGAGTGGTTKLLVPVLASLNVPVEYTYTDLSPSFTAAARKKVQAISIYEITGT